MNSFDILKIQKKATVQTNCVKNSIYCSLFSSAWNQSSSIVTVQAKKRNDAIAISDYFLMFIDAQIPSHLKEEKKIRFVFRSALTNIDLPYNF